LDFLCKINQWYPELKPDIISILFLPYFYLISTLFLSYFYLISQGHAKNSFTEDEEFEGPCYIPWTVLKLELKVSTLWILSPLL